MKNYRPLLLCAVIAACSEAAPSPTSTRAEARRLAVDAPSCVPRTIDGKQLHCYAVDAGPAECALTLDQCQTMAGGSR